MKETVAGAVLLLSFVIGLGWLFTGTVQPDLRTDFPEQGGSAGHPLWSD